MRVCSFPILCHMFCVTCHVSCVKFHVSRVTCHVSHILFNFYHYIIFNYNYLYIYTFFWTQWWSLFAEGLLLTGRPRLIKKMVNLLLVF